MRVLVVEDSPTQAAALRLLLESEGFEAAEAHDGRAGLARLHAERFDLVVSDVVMPEMDGYALCAAVRADPALADIPFLLLTALADPLDVVQALECGASAFMRKPYEPDRLVERVRGLLETRRLRAGGQEETFRIRGREVRVNGTREQVVDLLLCSLDDLLHMNEVLERQRARLADANAELESFSYSVSHDLRAPLRAIDGFSRALVEDLGDQLTGAALAHLTRVRAAAMRMSALIDALLVLSQVTRAPLRRADVDLSTLAEDVAHDLVEATPGRAVRVDVEPDMRVSGDPTLVRVLLENLLSNALKFTMGRPDAHVEVGSLDSGAERIFWVRDNGAGFDMAQVGRLFTPFQRLHDESRFSGTGIGLATVQRVVRRHGGRVWAEGEPERGATFYFTLGDGEA